MIRSIDELTPQTAAAARAWLEASVAQVPASYRGVVRDEMLSAMCAAVDADMTPEQFAGAVERIAPFVVEDDGADGAPAGGRDPRVGRWCGIPYDFRPPTGERVRQSMWNPADPRLLMPRAFGAGWDLNLGAIAVRLGFIEPDAEDVPFAEVPQQCFTLAAGLPFALTGAVVAHYAIRGRALPERLPNHWGPAGEPDAWVARRTAACTDIAVSLGASALAATTLRPARPGAERAGRLALAGMAGGTAAALTVARSVPKGGWWVGPLLVASMLGGAAAPLLGLALAGRRGEQRRDLAAQAAGDGAEGER